MIVASNMTADGQVARWLQEIADKSGEPLDVVQRVLTEHGVRAQTASPRPHRLLITHVSFNGLRPVFGEGGRETGEATHFDFSWNLGPGLWGLASSGKNEAGKSSILKIIMWCLTGRCDLQRDVRDWLRHVEVGFKLDDEALVVAFTVSNGIPSGRVVTADNSRVLITFSGVGDFEQAMDAFMMDRLGLEPLRTVQRAPHGADAPPVTGQLSWPSYASALLIDRAGLGALLGGGSTMHALPTRLLELFLGAPWASTMVAADVAGKIVAADLSAARKRAESDATARKTHLDLLVNRLEEAKTRLARLPEITGSAEDLQSLYSQLAAATQETMQSQEKLLQIRSTHSALSSKRKTIAAALRAVEEAALARAFFHTLTPTVCPRCDTAVGRDRLEQEKEGSCSLCSAELSINDNDDEAYTADQEAGLEELRAMLADVQVELDAAAISLESAQRDFDEATRRREDAAAALRRATSDTRAAQRREAELEVARLEGAVEERRGRFDNLSNMSDVASLQRAVAILKAAKDAAHMRRTAAVKDVLDKVNIDVTAMGRLLGLEMLHRVELGTSATLKVWKGGQTQNYGSLTEGEQLRIKIITTIALLRHGHQSGVGRHPGILLVDSPGAEEVASGDLRLMLQDLATLAELVPQLQIIVATARGSEVADVIPADHLRLATAGERLW
ncbi:hypothetical protein AB0O28_02125 [Microbispora sp. NPDC088329]|uniref:ATP-binding protein n=1 Tax=Microbispora sp. NPDC088329 TaxID=3154869 RepID=UPI0034295530